MTLLVYAVTGRDAVVTGTGLAGQALRSVKVGPLAAVVAAAGCSAPEQSVATLIEYEGAIERLMESGAALPMRFGSVLPDEHAVREMLERRREDLVAGLDRVRGSVELALRAQWTQSSGDLTTSAGDRSGAAYLRGRLEEENRTRRLAHALSPLADFAQATHGPAQLRPRDALQAAYLVDREHVDAFLARVGAIDRVLPDVDLVCTGPWPPYSFTAGAPV